MANQVAFDIIARDNASRTFRGVGDAADKTGKSFKGMAGDATDLDRSIAVLEDRMHALRAAIADAPDDKDLRKALRADSRELNFLTKIRKELLGPDTRKIGQEAGKAITGGIGDALGALPSQLKGIGIITGAALAVALTPMIGATVGAAVLGGVGAGGIAGGIAAAAQDPQVKAAGTHLAESLKADFAAIGKPFIEPLLEQMGRLEAIGGDFFSDLGEDIAPLANHLDELTDGIAGFAENLDFGAAVRAAEPLIDVLGDKLPDIGDALTDMFESIAEEGDGTALVLSDLLDITSETITEFGELVSVLSGAYESMRDLGDGFYDLLDAFKSSGGEVVWPWLIPFVELMGAAEGETDDFAEGVTKTRTRLHGFRDATEEAAEELRTFSDAIDEAFGKIMGAREANLRYEQGIIRVKEELLDGKRTLDIHTEAGQQNLEALNSQVEAIEALRVAEFKQNGDLATANKHYSEHIAQLEAVAVKLLGNTKEVREYFNALRNIPTRVETELMLKILSQSTLPSKQALEHAMEGRASGGPVKAGHTYRFNENGVEAVTFGQDGYVHNARDTAAMMSGASGGSYQGGAQEIRIILDIRADDEEQARRIRKQVEELGGGNVQVAYGSNT